MNKTEVTIVASCLLHPDKNVSLYNYFEEITPKFSFLFRQTVHHLKNDLNGEDHSKYRTRMKEEYDLTNRFTKAVFTTAKNTLRLSTAAGEYLHSTYDDKITKIFKKIFKAKKIINNPKTKKHRVKRQKTKLFWLEMKKNRLIQLKNNGPKPVLTFGTKELLKRSKELFLDKRDNQITYLGDKNEYLAILATKTNI